MTAANTTCPQLRLDVLSPTDMPWTHALLRAASTAAESTLFVVRVGAVGVNDGWAWGGFAAAPCLEAVAAPSVLAAQLAGAATDVAAAEALHGATLTQLQTVVRDAAAAAASGAVPTAECTLLVPSPRGVLLSASVAAAQPSTASGPCAALTASWESLACDDRHAMAFDAAGGAVGAGHVRCVPCPYGGDCSAVDAMVPSIAASPGFWGSHQQPTFVRCPHMPACAGGNATDAVISACAPAHRGRLCAECASGYHPQVGGACVACPGPAAAVPAVAAAVALLCVAVCITGARGALRLPPAAARAALRHGQIVAAVGGVICAATHWPPAFRGMVTSLQVLLLDPLPALRLACAVRVGFYGRFAVAMLLAAAVCAGAPMLARRKPRTGAVYLLTCCAAGVARFAVATFQCRTLDGRAWIAEDLSAPCSGPTWTAVAALSGAVLLAGAVAVSAAAVTAVCRWRHHTPAATVVQPRGSAPAPPGGKLSATAPPELVGLLHTVALVPCAQMLCHASRSPAAAFAAAVAVSSAFHVAHAAQTPPQSRMLRWAQHGALAFETALLLVALLVAVDYVDFRQQRHVWDAVLVTATALVGVAMAAAVMRQSSCPAWQHRSKSQTQRRRRFMRSGAERGAPRRSSGRNGGRSSPLAPSPTTNMLEPIVLPSTAPPPHVVRSSKFVAAVTRHGGSATVNPVFTSPGSDARLPAVARPPGAAGGGNPTSPWRQQGADDAAARKLSSSSSSGSPSSFSSPGSPFAPRASSPALSLTLSLASPETAAASPALRLPPSAVVDADDHTFGSTYAQKKPSAVPSPLYNKPSPRARRRSVLSALGSTTRRKKKPSRSLMMHDALVDTSGDAVDAPSSRK